MIASILAAPKAAGGQGVTVMAKASLGTAMALALAIAVLAAGAVAASPGDAVVPGTLAIPAGHFIAGSDRAEREAAYGLDEAAYGHARTREWRWYESEPARHKAETAAYAITITPITNHQYTVFTAATGHAAPDVDAKTWAGYGLVHPYERTRRHAWAGGKVPAGRAGHPVVLVSHGDATAYAAWLSARTGRRWRLPTRRSGRKRRAVPMAGTSRRALRSTRSA